MAELGDKTETTTEDSSSEQSVHGGNNTGNKIPPEPASGFGKPLQSGQSSGLFPDLSTVDWYLDPRFQRYWKHYHQVMNWYQKHLETCQMLSAQLNPSSSSQKRNFNPFVSRFSPYSTVNRTTMSLKSHSAPSGTVPPWTCPANNPTQRGSLVDNSRLDIEQQTSSKNTDVSRAKLDSENPSEEFEMEITDEMVEFFAQSRKHREERDKFRQLNNPDSAAEEHVDIEKAGKRKPATCQAPTERPGLRRTQEMKHLYGKGAAMIHGMETAMQMAFDHNTDVKQPKLWPNMPLKIVFS